MKAHRLLPAVSAALVIVLLASGTALAQGGPAIDWYVVASAGQPSSAGAVTINDTLGQPVTGPAQAGATALGAGYWRSGKGPAPPGPTVDWWVIANAGGRSSGGDVTLNDTLGQPFTGPAQSGTVALSAGYWYPGFGPTSLLGDVNADDLMDSADALIVLSADAGIATPQFCPMNCGDTNADGLVDSTDALIILSYDAGMPVPFPVGQPGCPATITQPAGCSP